MKKNERPPNRLPEESRAAWFVELERAKNAGDFARAAECQRRLAALGVHVRYVPQKAVAGA